ncbi:hypothetical protein DIPPA_03084 [Diplonema papillatum]|nr:hypothetical protein DIPPA_03084 [Diplonema papillatum]
MLEGEPPLPSERRSAGVADELSEYLSEFLLAVTLPGDGSSHSGGCPRSALHGLDVLLKRFSLYPTVDVDFITTLLQESEGFDLASEPALFVRAWERKLPAQVAVVYRCVLRGAGPLAEEWASVLSELEAFREGAERVREPPVESNRRPNTLRPGSTPHAPSSTTSRHTAQPPMNWQSRASTSPAGHNRRPTLDTAAAKPFVPPNSPHHYSAVPPSMEYSSPSASPRRSSQAARVVMIAADLRFCSSPPETMLASQKQNIAVPLDAGIISQRHVQHAASAAQTEYRNEFSCQLDPAFVLRYAASNQKWVQWGSPADAAEPEEGSACQLYIVQRSELAQKWVSDLGLSEDHDEVPRIYGIAATLSMGDEKRTCHLFVDTEKVASTRALRARLRKKVSASFGLPRPVPLSSVLAYDPATHQWNAVKDLPAGVGGFWSQFAPSYETVIPSLPPDVPFVFIYCVQSAEMVQNWAPAASPSHASTAHVYPAGTAPKSVQLLNGHARAHVSNGIDPLPSRSSSLSTGSPRARRHPSKAQPNGTATASTVHTTVHIRASSFNASPDANCEVVLPLTLPAVGRAGRATRLETIQAAVNRSLPIPVRIAAVVFQPDGTPVREWRELDEDAVLTRDAVLFVVLESDLEEAWAADVLAEARSARNTARAGSHSDKLGMEESDSDDSELDEVGLRLRSYSVLAKQQQAYIKELSVTPTTHGVSDYDDQDYYSRQVLQNTPALSPRVGFGHTPSRSALDLSYSTLPQASNASPRRDAASSGATTPRKGSREQHHPRHPPHQKPTPKPPVPASPADIIQRHGSASARRQRPLFVRNADLPSDTPLPLTPSTDRLSSEVKPPAPLLCYGRACGADNEYRYHKRLLRVNAAQLVFSSLGTQPMDLEFFPVCDVAVYCKFSDPSSSLSEATVPGWSLVYLSGLSFARVLAVPVESIPVWQEYFSSVSRLRTPTDITSSTLPFPPQSFAASPKHRSPSEE